MSIVSRSPSPAIDAMDVDDEDTTSKYDESISNPILEPVTVDTKIKPSNKGFALLAKMGWSEGHSLGLSGDGMFFFSTSICHKQLRLQVVLTLFHSKLNKTPSE